jgi:hypothetical protein
VEKDSPQRRTFRIEQSPLEKVRLWVEIAAFAAAGCWALYTFVYQTLTVCYARYPIRPRIAVRLAQSVSGAIDFTGTYDNINFLHYFGV